MVRCTMACSRVARPGMIVNGVATTVRTNNTRCVGPNPRMSGVSTNWVISASAGIVKPMLATADPSARLSEVCRRPRRAALTAARVSGSSTSKAMTTPTKAEGRPAAPTARSMAGDCTLASPTTATKESSRKPTLVNAVAALGGSAWSSSVIGEPSLATGRKKSRWRTVWVVTKAA